MIGAISGDVIGSVHEGTPAKEKDFALFVSGSRFTDDTVLTVAVASAIRQSRDFAASLRRWGRRYPDAGYGGWFHDWLFRDNAPPYNSFGNGSAMRVAPVGWAYDDLDVVLREATKSAEVTHNHPEGIKGAQAIVGNPTKPNCRLRRLFQSFRFIRVTVRRGPVGLILAATRPK